MDLHTQCMIVAKNEARLSAHEVPMGAAIVKQGMIISIGRNSRKTHPIGDSKRGCYMHAEMDAIVGNPRYWFKGATMYVYRERKDGTVGMARPCRNCMGVLVELKFKRVVYTNPDVAQGYSTERIA